MSQKLAPLFVTSVGTIGFVITHYGLQKKTNQHENLWIQKYLTIDTDLLKFEWSGAIDIVFRYQSKNRKWFWTKRQSHSVMPLAVTVFENVICHTSSKSDLNLEINEKSNREKINLSDKNFFVKRFVLNWSLHSVIGSEKVISIGRSATNLATSGF